MTCRICLDDEGEMIQPCDCKGTSANVHPECLMKWLNISQTTKCEICHFQYRSEVKTEDQACVFFPTCVLAEKPNTRRVVALIGVILCIVTQMEGLAFPGSMDGVFIVTNFFILLFVASSQCVCEDIHVLETLTYWKLCTFIGFCSLAGFLNDWSYATYEGIVLGAFSVLTYLYLVTREQTITYTEVLI